ncbi:MAG: hypothetical protein HY880_00180 [Deltaproteobacteria bacterium]|nr:hypothetical protein [Deltaproteobacteria bacterium]
MKTFFSKGKRTFFTAIFSAVLFISGCGGEKPAEQAKKEIPAETLPVGHPSMEGMATGDAMTPALHKTVGAAPKELKIGAEIKKRWSEVLLEITDTSSGKKDVLMVKVGGSSALKSAGYSIKVAAFVPDYTSGDDYIGSRSNDPNNPAALVELMEGAKSVAKGWIFKRLADFNSYKHERFNVVLLDTKPSKN